MLLNKPLTTPLYKHSQLWVSFYNQEEAQAFAMVPKWFFFFVSRNLFQIENR